MGKPLQIAADSVGATTGLERLMFACLPAAAREQTCREVGYGPTGRRCYQTTLCIIFNLLWAKAAIVMIILVGESILGGH
jgi:hypothetical protein